MRKWIKAGVLAILVLVFLIWGVPDISNAWSQLGTYRDMKLEVKKLGKIREEMEGFGTKTHGVEEITRAINGLPDIEIKSIISYEINEKGDYAASGSVETPEEAGKLPEDAKALEYVLSVKDVPDTMTKLAGMNLGIHNVTVLVPGSIIMLEISLERGNP